MSITRTDIRRGAFTADISEVEELTLNNKVGDPMAEFIVFYDEDYSRLLLSVDIIACMAHFWYRYLSFLFIPQTTGICFLKHRYVTCTGIPALPKLPVFCFTTAYWYIYCSNGILNN